jgi:hypothetical protein
VTNAESVVAGHWELLRRNKEFRALSARWLKSEVFRRSHALSPNYHDMQNHTPRCAWDWMLTAAQSGGALRAASIRLRSHSGAVCHVCFRFAGTSELI